VTLYKSFINKVYDLVGQPSYNVNNCYLKEKYMPIRDRCKFITLYINNLR